MKKRVLAALTAFVLILSAFAFTSCKEPTPKELFTDSLTNAIAAEEDSLLSKLLSGDVSDQVATFSFNVDKFKVQNQDLASMGKLSLSATASNDVDSGLSKVDMSFDVFGEKPTLGAVVDANGQKIYYTDLLGLNEKPILLEAGALTLGQNVANASVSLDKEAVSDVVKAISDVLNKNVTEEMFVSETKAVTVDGKEFDGATVITLDLSDEKVKTIAKELVDALLANETIKSMAGDELKYDESDLPKSIKLTNTVVDEKAVAFSIEISDKSEEKFDIRATLVDGNFKFRMGTVDENGSFDDVYFEIAYTLDGENERFNCSLYDDGKKTGDFAIIEGTYKDGVHIGKATIDTFAFDYKVTESENGVALEIEDTDAKFTANITYTDEKLEINGNIKYTRRAMEFSASYSITVESKDVTVEPITDYVSAKDVNLEDLLKKMSEKYPTIMSLLGGIQ